MNISRFDRVNALVAREIRKHPKRGGTLQRRVAAFRRDVTAATWKTTLDVKKQFGSADQVGANRIVFDLCGNSYRIVAAINYAAGFVEIRFAGTHEEYNAIDAKSV
jgi:mRNA interferase HigB